MSSATLLRWSGHTLIEIDDGDSAAFAIEAADSLLVRTGRAFALGMHHDRFLDALTTRGLLRNGLTLESVEEFWAAAFAMIPAVGDWFPRVELRSRSRESHLAFRHRSAPELTRSVTLMTHSGPDPRQHPSHKGPDLEALVAARTRATLQGADDVVLITSDGYIIDAGTNALVWWRGDTLCGPPRQETDPAFARVASITSQSLLALASAMGVETRTERTTPDELEGSEVWALNALHGIRMVTGWVGGPSLAEKPGRIGVWRDRREALRAPIGDIAP